jgi:cell division protein ZapA
MDKNEFRINIEIADKSYSLWIPRKDEKLKRDAAKQVKIKYDHCRKHYAKSVEVRDLLAMVAYKLSEENLLLEQLNDTTPFIEKIGQLTEKIDSCLNKCLVN